MNVKRVLDYSLASLMFAVVGCQQKLPNDIVLKSFGEKYPDAKYATWQHMEGSIWEAAFLWGEKERTALFEENGEWLETRSKLPIIKLPKVVLESYESAKTADGLVKIYQLETPNGIYYEFQLEEGKDPYKMVYDAQGKIVKNSIL